MWTAAQVPNGLNCRCVCPGCGKPLLAKNQVIKLRAHFAHHGEQACAGAFESAVHRMAKQLICDRLELLLPAWDGTDDMPNPIVVKDDRGSPLRSKRVDFPAKAAQLQTAFAEVAINDYRPDVTAVDEAGELLIEIRVSHAVGQAKARNVQSEGRRMVEIDLSRVSAEQAEDLTVFEHLVLGTASNRTWLSCPPATEAWRLAREDLIARLALRNRKIREGEHTARARDALRRQRAQEQEIQLNTERMQQRIEHLADLELLLQKTTPEAITAKYALLQQRDEAKGESLLSCIPAILHPMLRSSSGPAWAYEAHYLLWQPAMYLHFIAGKPEGHPVDRIQMGRWLRSTYGVDPVLWRLFLVQWHSRKEAQQRGDKSYPFHSWLFTDQENRAIPNLFTCVNFFVERLISAGVIEADDELGGKLLVCAIPGRDPESRRKSSLPIAQHVDPLLETGVDRYLDRWISHKKLGVGVVRRRVTRGSPNYQVWFNDAYWRTVYLGNPMDPDWHFLGGAEPTR